MLSMVVAISVLSVPIASELLLSVMVISPAFRGWFAV
jgi:hypothetical protein